MTGELLLTGRPRSGPPNVSPVRPRSLHLVTQVNRSLALDTLDAPQIHLATVEQPNSPPHQLRHHVQHDLVTSPAASPSRAMLTPPASRMSFPSATARACSTAAAIPLVTNV